MRTRRALIVALVVALSTTGCVVPDGPAAPEPATDPDAARPLPVTQSSVPVDGHALVTAWADEATLAARNGPSVLLRFASVSRQPGLVAEPDCVPPFAGVLRDDAEALADASVTRQGDGTYAVRGVDLRVNVAIEDGRAGHLDGCGGPASLRDEAEDEERERMAAERTAAAAEQADRVAAEQADREAAEQADREAAELATEQAARQAAEDAEPGTAEDAEPGTAGDAEPGTAEGELPADGPLDDRVEVFPRDRTTSPSG
jgi:hypothetical protein